jgi:DNA-directed RNA polymerase subunit RPC12/RpoP
MKFVCDRCGKKYATADDPAPGKVYKLKCKACGHLIVVRAQAGTSTALPAVAAPPAATQGPEIELNVEPEAPPHAPPPPEPMDDAVVMDAPLPPEVASAVDAAAPVPAGDVLPPPPPPDKDELADF